MSCGPKRARLRGATRLSRWYPRHAPGHRPASLPGRGAGGPPRPGHPRRALARRAYGAIASGAALFGRAADATMERRGIGEEVRLSTTRQGSAMVAALNGLIGDRLEASGSELHQPASVRVEGEAVAIDSGSLRTAFPDATGRVVVFLHGLMGTEFYWDWGGDHPGDTDGARLASRILTTPPYICATTPACTSLKTVGLSRHCSTSWWGHGRWRFQRSRWWVTRWGA